MQVMTVATTLAVAAILLLLRLPTQSSPSWLPWLVAVWAMDLPLELIVQGILPLPQLPSEDRRLYPDFQATEGERSQAQRCVDRLCDGVSFCS